ncbi:hypothetical protein JVX91_08340 [Pseudomonas sp. PDNC002]|uniref:hypothetical protein n=1 Tax=Pseudomonas sp. PDNC002 TaxID=2811422 RepID=UPI0019636ABE|nr:hypothetical protein [Pseudomonas sp. PDNC002]QRY81101.1 hypothetical protein JVX91_08340 [Pseudomonas sp. PDNC002]
MNRFWLALGLAGFLFGGILGGWLAAGFYGGQLESLRQEQARCRDAGKALASELAQQNAQVEALEQAARLRTVAADHALDQARKQAQSHETAARRLLLERSEGDECAVVRQLIDRELMR